MPSSVQKRMNVYLNMMICSLDIATQTTKLQKLFISTLDDIFQLHYLIKWATYYTVNMNTENMTKYKTNAECHKVNSFFKIYQDDSLVILYIT